MELTKARLVALVLATTAAGFLLADGPQRRWADLALVLLGTALAAGGSNAVNQGWEADRDRRMERTRRRPVPAARISRSRAVVLGMALTAAGVLQLGWCINVLTAALGATAAAVYIAIYTPLKVRTPLSTLLGAVSGAIPPLMGWTAARGRIDEGAWLLGALLFVWQIPHFLALGWLYRHDYARGGFRILPVLDPSGSTTCQVVLLYSLALLAIGPATLLTGLAGWSAAAGGLLLSAGFLAVGLHLDRQRSERAARRLFVASVVYLPLVLGLMIIDRGPDETRGKASAGSTPRQVPTDPPGVAYEPTT